MKNFAKLGITMMAILSAVQVASAQFLLSPQAGDVYKEFSFVNSGGNSWRVTDPNSTFNSNPPGNNPADFLPNPTLTINGVDLVGATRAELVLDMWGGHIGTTPKQVHFKNPGADTSYITIPEITSVPDPLHGQCYMQQTNNTVAIPLSQLVSGSNLIQANAGPQDAVCGQSFGWGQWGWNGAVLRIYYNPATKAHATGTITSPTTGGSFGENPLITASTSGSVSSVDFLGYYTSYDIDGDGRFTDWQHNYHRLGSESQMQIHGHIGTATTSPYQVNWNTTWVPDQTAGSIKLQARIRDNNGVYYVTPEISNLTLTRSGSVKMYTIFNLGGGYWIRNGGTVGTNFNIPPSDNLANATAARMFITTWNGQDCDGGEHNTSINGNYTFPGYGGCNYWSYDVFDFPTSALIPNQNAINIFSASAHHGIEVMVPGPAVMVRYNAAGTPAITTHPSNQTVTAGQTAAFSVVATGSAPLSYQWQKNSSDISGATSANYTTPATVFGDNGATFKCVVSNTLGTITSNAAILTVNSGISTVGGPWWNTQWHYRTQVAVNGGGFQRTSKVANFQLNFTTILSGLGVGGSFNPLSVRVIEVDGSGNAIDQNVVFQFDQDPAFNASTNALGTVAFQMSGTTGANTTRYYHIYFDTGAGFTLPSFSNLLSLTDNVSYQGQLSYQINNQLGSLVYHKQGGGFASMKDLSNVEWIGYNNTVGSHAGGEYRGIPNLGITGHPGYTNVTSSIISQGPIKITIKSQTNDGSNYTWFWDFYPTYSTMTLTAAGSNYWMLYEGTPNGALDQANGYVKNSASQTLNLGTSFAADLPSPEWAYFGTTGQPRFMFLAHHEDDAQIDHYRPFNDNGLMTVFGFGRDGSGTNRYMNAVPQHMTFGLGENEAQAQTTMNDAYRDIATSTGTSEQNVTGPAAITQQPTNQNVVVGSTATFTLGATGSSPLSYRWQKNSVNIGGATSPSYITPATLLADSGSTFRCIVSNALGTATSNAAILGVSTAPSSFASDDFSAVVINTSLWTIVNPAPASTIDLTGTGTADALLRFQLPASSHDVWTGGNFAPRLMQNSGNVDFTAEVKFQSTLTAQYQMQGIIVEQDANTYLRFDFLRNAGAVVAYSASFSGGNPTQRINTTVTTSNPMWLRVNRSGNVWTMSYSNNGTAYTTAGTYSQTLTVNKVGPFAGNAGNPSPATTVLVDYFFNTASPVVPEDPTGPPTPPGITTQPTDQTVDEGLTATFRVVASGTVPLSYRWQKNTIDIGGATDTNYTTPPTTSADSGATFRCIVSNANGTVTSNAAILRVNRIPATITVEPINQVALLGQTATFSLTAIGTQPISYQWQKGGINIGGAINASYTTPATILSDDGALFRCILSNALGGDTSATVMLTVSSQPAGTIISDDFHTGTLNTSLWTFTNPSPASTLSFTGLGTADALLSIAVPAGGSGHDVWGPNNAPRIMQNVTNGDFQAEVKFQSTMTAAYQMQGIIVEQDASNYLRFDFLRDPSGIKVFAASCTAGASTQRILTGVIAGSNPLWLRVDRTTNSWTCSYSSNGTTFTTAGTFSQTLTVAKIGPYAGNAPSSSSPAFTMLCDYFFNRQFPINPEDPVGPPEITTQPSNQTVFSGQTATFTVVATGASAYQWQKNTVNIGGANSASYITPATVQGDSGATFRCIVSNPSGTVTSSPAILNVVTTPPNITTQPSNQTVGVGQTASFSVVATGSLPLSYQWKKNNIDIGGATNTSYITPATVQGDSGATFRCVVSNIAGTVTSDSAILNVTVIPPSITTHPANLTVQAGQTATFNVVAAGSLPRAYQWQKNNANIGGATDTSYTTPATVAGDNGATFRCIVSNSAGTITSNSATLTVNTQPAGTIISDDFHTGTLNTSLWTYTNPNTPSTLSFTGFGTADALLSIALPAGGSGHDVWGGGNQTPRILQTITDQDFTVEAKFQSLPTLRYQFQGILVQQDINNFIRFDLNHDGTVLRVFAASFVGGSPTTRINAPVTPGGTMWLRVSRSGNTWTVSHSVNGTTFITDGTFSHTLAVSATGPFGGNASGASSPAFTMLCDYFSNTAFPANPEDPVGPPEITTQPSNQTVFSGQTATFTVVATGASAYQWQKNTVNIGGANSASYITPATVQGDSGATFRCIVSNPSGTVTSSPAILNVVTTPPNITTQPSNQTVGVGQTASFSVVATGSLPLSYQWKKNNIDIGGATNTSYITPATVQGDSGATFRCVVSNIAGTVTSDSAILNVTVIPPSITTHPANLTVQAGQTATFNVVAAGSLPRAYQWQKNNANIGGATDTSYTTPATVAGDNGATFRCIVSNSAGTITSNSATLTVNTQPAGTIISDDFHTGTLNTSLWTYTNPNTPSTLSFTGFGTADALLSIALPAGGSGHDVWGGGNQTPRILQTITDQDFTVEAKFQSLPTLRYQFQGILVQQDINNFIRFDLNHDGTVLRVFAASFVGGSPTTRINAPVTPGGTMWLRVSRSGNTWTVSHSVNGTTFITDGTFSHTLAVSATGPFGGNASGASSPAFTMLCDYFSNTAFPANPEDPTVPVITSQPTSQSVLVGNTATFNVSAISGTPLSYQWQKNNVNVGGATDTSYTTPATVQGDSGAIFRCLVSNSSGTVTSSSAILNVMPPPPPSNIVSDDFHTGTLNGALWTFVNPLGDASMTLTGAATVDALLNIGLPGGTRHDFWTNGYEVPRIMQNSNNADFTIEAKFQSVFSGQYQSEGIVVEQDATNVIRFDLFYDGANVNVFAASFIGGFSSPVIRVNAIAGAGPHNPAYLRINRSGNNWTVSYSFNGSTFTQAGTFSLPLTVSKVGVWGGNTGSNPAFTMLCDYFFNTASPIVYEDPLGPPAAPFITQQPTNQIANEGQPAVFSVVVTGNPPPTFQWQKNNVNIPGATDSNYTTPATVFADSGSTFRCIVSNSEGTVTSNAAILSVNKVGPSVAQQPTNKIASVGQTATFTIAATGSPTLLYQWKKNNVDISGANDSSYTTPVTVLADSGSDFRCVISNAIGTVTSSVAILHVITGAPPGAVQSDDFHTGTLDTIWSFVNPLSDATLSFTGVGTSDARISIALPAGTAHALYTNVNTVPRVMQTVNNQDFTVDVKIESNRTAGFQEQGIIVEQDANNLMRFDAYFDGGGTNLYVLSFAGGLGSPVTRLGPVGIGGALNPLWLRINRSGNSWTVSYSTNGTTFTTAGSFSHTITMTKIGVFAGNEGGPPPAYTALFDYFFNTAYPINPEDPPAPPAAPSFTQHPANQIVSEGQTAAFSVIATGNPAPSLQWQKNNADIPGATNASYTTPASVYATDNAATFRCIASNATGTVTSNAATLTVNQVGPTITSQPVNQVVQEGATVSFAVSATGSPTLVYQWQKNSVNIGGANSASYMTPPTVAGDNGALFRCIVSNAAGTVTSDSARLTVQPPGTFISDDFHTGSLNSSLWTYTNPNAPTTLSLTGAGTSNALLSMALAGGGSGHDVWTGGNFAPRIMQNIGNGNFTLEAKFQSLPSQVHQMEGLIIQQDANTYLRFDFLSLSGGPVAFAASFTGGNPSTRINTPIVSPGNPIWMRLNRTGNTWTMSYSTNGTTFTTAGTFGQTLTVSSAGVFGGNATGATSPAFTMLCDYIFNTAFPITPEDPTGPPAPPNITKQPSDTTVIEGQSATFSVVATGSPSPTYQWQKSNVNIGGATNSSYTTPPTTSGDNGATFRCIVSNASGTVTSSAGLLTVTASGPGINVWYGTDQSFGTIGHPIPYVNILGDANDPDGIQSLRYTLNGGSPVNMQHIADGRRIDQNGDFNVEIPRTSLNTGANTVVITLTDNLSNVTTKTVTVNYTGTGTWPQTYSINWNSAASVTSVAQPADGLWTLDTNSVRMIRPGYDRLLDIGEQSWTNYEVSFPFTVHSFTADGFGDPSYGPGIGAILRWNGNTDNPLAGANPKTGYLPLGSIGWFHWSTTSSGNMQMLNNNASVIAQDNSGFIPLLNVQYVFKMKVFSTGPGQAPTYRMKIWLASQSEPASWSLSFTGSASDPSSGCIGILAQECDVNIGNITVVPAADAARPSVGGTELVALYRFNEGKGDIVHDVSGNGAPLNLTINNPESTTWTGAGLQIGLPTIISSGVAADKVVSAVKASNEITVEAWLKPAIFTYTVPSRVMDFEDQGFKMLEVLHGVSSDRSTLSVETSIQLTTTAKSAVSGTPASAVNNNELAHLVLTRDGTGQTLLYINGVEQSRGMAAGSFESWKNAIFVLGGGEDAWLGEYMRVTIYSRALSQSEVNQNFNAGPEAEVEQSALSNGLTGVAQVVIPTTFALYQNYPNPFNPTTTIKFDLPKDENVTLTIYNLLGQRVATIVDERRSAGSYAEQWNAQGIASGVYLYRIKAGDFIGTRKFVLLK